MQPTNDTPEPPATSYVTVQSSGGPYKASSIKEGFICSGIWAVLALVVVSGLRLWAEHSQPEKGVFSAEDWGGLIGTVIGRFILMGICMSSVWFYRRRKNVTLFILLDWRWWLVCFILSIPPNRPIGAWLLVGLIYQGRQSLKPKSPSATT